MAEFTLKPKEPDWLTVNIGENSYKIPLITSLPPAKVKSLDTFEASIDFFNEYLPEDIQNSLLWGDYNDIAIAWKAASEKLSKRKPGE